MTRVVQGLGWPQEGPTLFEQLDQEEFDRAYEEGESVEVVFRRKPLTQDEIVALLEELREEVAPEWGVKRGTWNFAIVIAKGLVRSIKKEK